MKRFVFFSVILIAFAGKGELRPWYVNTANAIWHSDERGIVRDVEKYFAERCKVHKYAFNPRLTAGAFIGYSAALCPTNMTLGEFRHLVLQVIEFESQGHVEASNRNHNGTKDYGLMQVNTRSGPEIAKRVGLYVRGRDFIDPRVNILTGMAELAPNIQRYGLTNGLARYNAGHRHKIYGAKYCAAVFSQVLPPIAVTE